MNKTQHKRVIRRLLMALVCLAAALVMLAGGRAYAEGEDLVVTGPAGSYTYENGVVTINQPGTYSISMAEGVTESTDRIVINSRAVDGWNTTLQLNDVKLTNNSSKVQGRYPVIFDAAASTTPGDETKNVQCTILLNGKSTLTSPTNPIWAGTNYIDYTFKSANGSKDDSLELVSTNDGSVTAAGNSNFNCWNLLVDTATVKMQNMGITAFESVKFQDAKVDVQGKGYLIYIYSSYADQFSYTMLDSEVKLTVENLYAYGANQNAAIAIASKSSSGKLGEVKIEGGKLTATTDMNAPGGWGIYAPGNVVIDKDAIVDIHATNTGIRAVSGGSFTMNGKLLTVHSSGSGVWVTAGAATFAGGTTELTGGSEGLGFPSSNTDRIKFDPDYNHVDYDGDTAEGRQVISDDEILTEVEGRVSSRKYLLITPGYPIEYDLDGGALEPEVTNPEIYTYYDEAFTLNNPVKEGATFIGWTGTDLEEPTKEVTVAEGSEGRREYKANWDTEVTINYRAGTGGSIAPTSETVLAAFGKAEGSTATPKAGYEFVNWTDEDGREVSKDEHFIPEKTDGKYAAATYIANFKKKEEKSPDILLARMVSKGANGLRIDWTKVGDADGYDIFFNRCDTRKRSYKLKLVKTVEGNRKLVWSKKGLTKKRAYKCRVKAYVLTKKGKKKYIASSLVVHAYTSGGSAKFTNPKSVTLKKQAVTLKKGKSFKIKAGVKKLKKNRRLPSVLHAKKLRYISSDEKVATVSATGTVEAVKKGTCKVYVLAVNGVRKAITVKVK